MNHFDTDNREFAKHFVKFGLIPTDDELPYEASEESAMGGYVHPMKDIEKFRKKKLMNDEENGIRTEQKTKKNMKKTIKISENKLRSLVKEHVARVLSEAKLPKYDEPVFIECTSPQDADVKVEIGYSSYNCSLFYVGGCGTDAYAALAVIVQWLEENGLIWHYAYNEEDMEAYAPEDFIEVEGYNFPSWQIHMEQIVDNHGGRPNIPESLIRKAVNESIKSLIKENVEYDDAWAISDELAKMGWAYSDSQDVVNRNNGRQGIRWRIEPYRSNPHGVKPVDLETVKTTMTNLLGAENIEFSGGHHMYAPEISFTTMITLEPQQ